MTVRTDPYTFVNGTVANALEVNARFDQLYDLQNSKIDSTNLNLTTTYAWSGVHTHTANLNLHSGADLNIYSDAGTTLKFKVDGTTGDFGVASGAKLFIDGTNLAGTTYIYQSSAGRMDLYAGGVNNLQLTSTISAFGLDVQLAPTKKLYFDNGVDTFAYEKSANLFVVATAGVDGLGVSGGDGIGIEPAKRFYFDGIGMTGNTYQYQSSSDVYGLVVGGTTMLQCQNNGTLLTTIYSDLNIPATKKMFYDGGGDTYDTESSANVLDRYVGGNKMLSCTSSTIVGTASSLISMTVNSDTSIVLGPTYITIDGDVMSLGVPFMTINADSNTGSDQHVVKITGSNSGAGFAAAIDLTDVGTNLNYAFEVAADGTALGAYSGRIPIRVGANTRYIPYYV